MLKLRGCKEHNLKGINLNLKKGTLIAITGVSGSGKSSLAFDTIFAEGQHRYLELLSLQTRSLLRQLPRPSLDSIEGLSPTLAIGESLGKLSTRSTVASHSDIYDLLCLLYAHLSEQYSPVSGLLLPRQSSEEIIETILKKYPDGTRIQILSPISLRENNIYAAVQRLQKLGYIRLRINNIEMDSSENFPEIEEPFHLSVIVDRLAMSARIRQRLSDSVLTALKLSEGQIFVQEGKSGPITSFSEVSICPESEERFPKAKPNDFKFYSPYGACPQCEGKGEGCSSCKGGRLKQQSLYCRVQGLGIHEFCKLNVEAAALEIKSWIFPKEYQNFTNEILPKILDRLHFLQDVGLGYLPLNQRGNTLSQGETQRVQLATQLASKLSGILYILDEPSRGLHPRDIQQLSLVIKKLCRLGNSVILVEHNPSLLSHADEVITLGPGSGKYGGEVTYQGPYQAKTFNKPLEQSSYKRESQSHLTIGPVSQFNLKGITVSIPLNSLVALCGVSGSGKSTLAMSIAETVKNHTKSPIQHLSIVDQQARSSTVRSTVATYIRLMQTLRQLFAETKLAKARGYTSSDFSLNKKGGRCEECEGAGEKKLSMSFLPDVFVPCTICQGQRFHYEILQVRWGEHSFDDILNMTAEEATSHFSDIPDIRYKLDVLCELGLNYLTLGQNFTQLSGGEIQRLKLASELVKKRQEHTLYLFDEPTAGLHLQDVDKLMRVLQGLVNKGHSVIMVEHHREALKQADHLIELGPSGGPKGGYIIFEGSPQKIKTADTATAQVLC